MSKCAEDCRTRLIANILSLTEDELQEVLQLLQEESTDT